MDPKFHDSRQAFKNTCIRRELLDIRRLDGNRVFLGAIDGSGKIKGRLQTYFFNDDANEVFVGGICGNLPMYLYAYLKNVKGYSERSILAILSGCNGPAEHDRSSPGSDAMLFETSPLQTDRDAAKEEVAKGLRFNDKPGYNPTSADAASVLTDKSQSTTGAAAEQAYAVVSYYGCC
eukprot:scaffold21040_cov41-Cyclotella_meneghiniana.AAC.4